MSATTTTPVRKHGFVKKYRKPKPLAELGPMEIDDPELEKYKDQIEKDLANLE